MNKILFCTLFFIVGFEAAFCQVSITNAAPTATVNFSAAMQTTVGTNPGTAFTGAGFAIAPTSGAFPGRLNSNAWETKGWSNGNLLFGNAMSNPAHGRGSVASGVITEGIYAYTDAPASVANPALMIQPADGDLAPGSIALRIKNNGTTNMTQLQVLYNLFVRNDENSSSSFNFSHSPDNVVYEDEVALNYTSPSVADPFQWVSIDVTPSRQMIISGINVAPGAFYYIRWSCEDVSGTGNRDEFGLDDIVITGSYGAPAPEINVVGNSTTILNGDMTPQVADGTQFANAFTGGSASIMTYVIQNLGGANLNISGITITGTNASDFTIQGTAPIGIIPGVAATTSSVNLVIKFTPSASGSRTAVVNIANTDANENPYTYRVQGTGVIPQPDIELSGFTTPNTSPIFSTNMIPVTNNCTLFAPQVIGSAGQTLSYKIKNNGTAAMLLLTAASPYIVISGANASDFTLVTFPVGNSMNPGFTKFFSINFSPSAAGIRTALVTIPNNDVVPDVFGNTEGPFTFLIQGNGVAPEMDLVGNLQPIIDGSTTPSFSNHTFFDYMNILSGTLDRTYTIQNTGSMALTVGAVTITGSSDYSVLTTPAASVAVGGSTTFTIRFNPTTTGVKNAMVNVVNSDSNENPYNFNISGYGLDYIPCTYGVVETIAMQDFETSPATPVWTYGTTGTSTITNGTGFAISGDSGLTNKFIGGRSLQVSNSTTTLTFATVNASQYSEVELNLRISSPSGIISDGADITDKVTVAVSTDGGAIWSNELEVKGNTDAKWAFTSGLGIASAAYDGNNVVASFGSASGGFVTSDGFSTISVTALPKVANLRIRVTINNNNANEIWALDNAALFGRKEISSTWNGTVWSNGIPSNTIKAIIDGNYNTATNGNLQACKCLINSGRNVVIQSNQFFSIESDLNNYGTIVIEDKGSLVQKNDFATNAGNISVKRFTTPMVKFDYTYWSSPVSGQTLFNLSPLTLSDKFFLFNPIINNWQNALSGAPMIAGKGYIARAPQTFSTTVPAPYVNGQFVGVTHNGFIQTTIAGTSGAWNLIGNPYPSAIDADLFLGFSANTGIIGGTIYFWTHNTPITNFVYTANDYAVYNLTGGVGTAAPSTGVNNSIPTGNIASGQGFFVVASTAGQATFNNSMRLTGNNDAFYRATNSTVTATAPTGIEKNRVWLDLTNDQGAYKQTLVGYIEGATDEIDRNFDGTTLDGGNSVAIYSILETQPLAIQGRKLPFDVNDIVPIGYRAGNDGTFTISIEQTDGFMISQSIYLEDLLLNVIHDLKVAPYSFSTLSGTFNSRFQLRYTAQVLGINAFNEGDSNLIVTVKSDIIGVFSNGDAIKAIAIYDLLGRIIADIKDVNDTNYAIDNVTANQQALIVKVTLNSGQIINRKIIF